MGPALMRMAMDNADGYGGTDCDDGDSASYPGPQMTGTTALIAIAMGPVITMRTAMAMIRMAMAEMTAMIRMAPSTQVRWMIGTTV